VNVLKLATSSPERGGAAELELDGLAAPGRFHPLDLVQLLHPALDLGGVRGARLEALDELDLLGEHRLLALELRLALLLAQRTLLLVEIVIAGIGREASRRRSPRPCRRCGS
jgi:hypothetical protein